MLVHVYVCLWYRGLLPCNLGLLLQGLLLTALAYNCACSKQLGCALILRRITDRYDI